MLSLYIVEYQCLHINLNFLAIELMTSQANVYLPGHVPSYDCQDPKWEGVLKADYKLL